MKYIIYIYYFRILMMPILNIYVTNCIRRRYLLTIKIKLTHKKENNSKQDLLIVILRSTQLLTENLRMSSSFTLTSVII